MSTITELSLVRTPKEAAERDSLDVEERRQRAEASCANLVGFAREWAMQRGEGETFADFE